MRAPHESGKRLIAKNSVLNFLGQVLPGVIGVVTIRYIIKGLGTDAYGILSIAYIVLGYFSIFDLGLSRATVKFVAEHLSPEKIHRIPELVWTSLSLLFILGCIGGLLVAAFVPLLVTRLFKMPPSFIGQAKLSLYILCAAMPIMLGSDALRGVLEAAQRFDWVNYVKVPSSICFYLFAALAIPFGVKVTGIVTILVLIRLATGMAYLLLSFRVIPGLRSGFRFSREAVRPLTVFGGWVMVSNLTGPLFGYLERFMIASVLSVGMLTYYSVPFDLIAKAIIFPASLAPALFPYFSYHGGRGGSEVSDVTSRSVKYLLLVMTPITALFCFFAKDILRLWLGAQFAAQSTVVLQVLALSFFLNALAYIPYTSVQALGRPELKAILDLVALPAYALYCWWLLHKFGINGAALAKLLSAILDTGFLFLFAWRMKSFSVRDCISGPLFRALLASAGLLLTVFTFELFHPRLIVSAVLLMLSFLAYTTVFWFAAVDSDERGTIRGLYQVLLARR
jgi:O-antigen/teichoic acid export membrane protein